MTEVTSGLVVGRGQVDPDRSRVSGEDRQRRGSTSGSFIRTGTWL